MTSYRKAFFALLTTVLLWGTSFVAIRQSVEDFSPGALALLRYLIATLAMIPFYFSLPSRTRLRFTDVPRLFLLGLFGIGIYNILLNQGETTTSAAIASFIVSQIPAATIILAVIFLKERLTRLSWLGLVVSLCGILLLTLGENKALGHFNHGVIYLVLAAFCGAIFSIMQKPLLTRFRPLEMTAWSIWFGTLSLLFYTPSLWHEIQHQPVIHYAWPIFLGVGSGVIGYACLAYGFKHYPAAKAASFLFAMPLVSVVMGYVFLDEVPTWFSLFGGVTAMLGALMIRVKR